MAETKVNHSVINDILPPEMVEKILKLLNYKEINQAKLICKRWKEIIDNGNLANKASGNFLSHKFKHFLYDYAKVLLILIFFLESIFCIIVAGGQTNSEFCPSVEFVGDIKSKKFPNLPIGNSNWHIFGFA